MAIQQHPLPQDISSYRFRLIGDMTIKQFGFLAAGIILAVVFYYSPLPFFFKYPIAFIFLVLGIGSAFVPVQGRPLDQWIIAFIKSIYSPTQYVWRQTSAETQAQTAVPPTFTTATKTTSTPKPASAPAAPAKQTPVSLPEPSPSKQPTSTIQASPAPIPKPKPVSTPPTPPIKTEPQKEALAEPAPPPSIPTETPSPVALPKPDTREPAPHTTLPIPFTPTTPNTLVGLTLTPDGKILESVLVEILSQGLTIRATKSNRLGQFRFARPMENGRYQIAAEKPGYTFATYSIELKGKIISPLKIQAQSVSDDGSSSNKTS